MKELLKLPAGIQRATNRSTPSIAHLPYRTFLATAILAIATLLLLGMPPAYAQAQQSNRWVGTWTAGPQLQTTETSFSNLTLRQIVHTSVSGSRVRVRFTNEFGTEPLTIGEAHIARQQSGSSITRNTDQVVTFSGQKSVTIPPGTAVLSDAIDFDVPAESNLAISIYVPDFVTASTTHLLSAQRNYRSGPGNNTSAAEFPTSSASTGSATGALDFGDPWYFLSGVYVERQQATLAIVTLGDSITEGYASTVNANHRWPNYLSKRILACGTGQELAVLNQAISGNRLLHNSTGPNALSRYDRDVLAQPNVRYVIVLLGINDIGYPGPFAPISETVTANNIIAAHRQLIARAHLLGKTIYGATLTPFEGTIVFPGYFTPEREQMRQAVNTWIRTSGEYDGVIDFDKAIQDPAHPTRILPAYDSGDHLHPNDAGYEAMAASIDLSFFKSEIRTAASSAGGASSAASGSSSAANDSHMQSTGTQ